MLVFCAEEARRVGKWPIRLSRMLLNAVKQSEGQIVKIARVSLWSRGSPAGLRQEKIRKNNK